MVITSYTDNCEGETFNFKVRVSRKFTSMTDDEIFKTLKLIGDPKLFAENYTIMGANNRIDVCKTPEEIFDKYFTVRLDFYNKRKVHLIGQTKRELIKLASKYFFIKAVTEDKIIINKKSKIQIIKQIESFDNIQKDDDTYDYLLRMPLYSLTKEKMDDLKAEISDKKFILNEYKTKEPTTFWKEDLELLKAHL